MSLLTNESTSLLWQRVLKDAQKDCAVHLEQELESYLIALLNRYTNQPDITRHVFAKSFLEAMQQQDHLRNHSLQQVGDQCLLYAGLFPRAAARRLVKIGYFVDLGRSAYAAVSGKASELYGELALEFVLLMDVLQSIRPDTLTPVEAHEQWESVGSQRALRMLSQYYEVIVPFKRSY